MRTAKPEKFIKAETIRIGDTIRVTWKDGDVTCSRVGVVAYRDHVARGTYYYTAHMTTLLYRNGNLQPLDPVNGKEHVTITLLDTAPELAPALF